MRRSLALSLAALVSATLGLAQSVVEHQSAPGRDGTSVASHSQPCFDSGFPHGRDQFFSAAATNWAVMPLSAASR